MNRYAKGRRWEYEVKQRLEHHGWIVFRCAGSKPVDLVAFHVIHLPLVVECKVGRRPPRTHINYWVALYSLVGVRYLVAVKK